MTIVVNFFLRPSKNFFEYLSAHKENTDYGTSSTVYIYLV
jgi:hypothetical protein